MFVKHIGRKKHLEPTLHFPENWQGFTPQTNEIRFSIVQ